MPLYEVKCTSCHALDEVLCEFEDLERITCVICDSQVLRRTTMFARHGSWSGSYSGYYDRGLGCYVESYQHREKLMKERGLRPVSSQELEEGVDKTVNDFRNHDKQISKLKLTGV
tara:strand:- start:518 stop:862 length:345 start_codon:yes stop_codon:yes gene_type:complete